MPPQYNTTLKPPPAVAPKDHVYVPGEQPRQKPVRYSGEKYYPPKFPQPDARPPEKENPMHNAAEPFSFPQRPERKPHWRDKLEVRRVGEADLPELLSWGFPRIQEMYPRATIESVEPMLRIACRGGRFAFFRTETAVGLYCAERTPWEPELTVYGVFLISKNRSDDDLTQYVDMDNREKQVYRTSLSAGLQPMAVLEAAYKWAKEIGAIAFMFGSETKFDVSKFAERIGFDHESHGFVRLIKRE